MYLNIASLPNLQYFYDESIHENSFGINKNNYFFMNYVYNLDNLSYILH